MNLSRRSALTLLTATAGAACVPTLGAQNSAVRAEPNAAFDSWIDAFRGRARAAGISDRALTQGLRGVGFLPGVIERDRNQTEFQRTTEDYLAIVASEEDVALGRRKYQSARRVLAEVEARYGVQASVMASIWGVESRYGTLMGDFPVISSVATLAFDGRRGRFFEAQLIAALRIIQNGDTTPNRMVGSWAGAMGHTQLIPTTYEEYGVDFRGDGRREIWTADPTDGLASTANYLARFGWRRDEPWGMEVRLPETFDRAATGRRRRRFVSAWRGLGVTRPDGSAIPDFGEAALHAPGGAGDPGFILYHNFNVILRYNLSTNYGVGVGFLADRIAGAPPLQGVFGPDETGLTQAERREIQRLLGAAGHDAGTPDGVIGWRTEEAIRAYQRAQGLPVDGRASPSLLARLSGR